MLGDSLIRPTIPVETSRACTVALAALVLCSFSVQPSANAAQSRSYVVSLFVPAMYSQEGDCKVIEPVAQNGRSPIESMMMNALLEQGKTPDEAAELLKAFDIFPGNKTYEMVSTRGRIDGKPVNVFQNPESAPDPNLATVVGKYAIGFNLDGRGEDDPDSFQDPYTGEKGIDNQFFRASGCTRTSRAVAPELSSHWVVVWDENAAYAPAVVITITGEDLTKDGEVVVTFARAIERTQKDALAKVRRDMSFELDPNPLTRVALPGKMENGTILVDDAALRMDGEFVTTPFDLTSARLRLRLMPDGSLDGLLGGYQEWETLYHFYYGRNFGTEAGSGINVVGIWYALKTLADADPDPVTRQNRRISVTYAFQAVPAFAAPARANKPSSATAETIGNRKHTASMATPMGITIQIPTPNASERFVFGYTPRKIDAQYYADSRGMTLYTYDRDRPNESSCYDECAREWLPLIAPKGAKAFGDWTFATRRDGRKQWAHRGRPLYTFAKDTVVGEAAGVPTSQSEDSPQGSPWKVAAYSLAKIVTPAGIAVWEVADANGEVLIDMRGRTLYTFDGDLNSTRCLKSPCASSSWIPFAAGRLANPTGDFTVIQREDGINQWVYKGKGLYTFRNDIEPGDANGVGVDKQWQPALVRQFYTPPQVKIRKSLERGMVLNDEHGMTLYRRSATSMAPTRAPLPVAPEEGRVIGTRSCDAECTKSWIPFEAPASAQSSGFWQVLTREDGKRQWSYKGYALYRYARDENPGDARGDFVYDLFTNRFSTADPDAATRVALDIRAITHVALVWSPMFP